MSDYNDLSNDLNLQSEEFFQTKVRGSNDQEYQIYVECAESLGWDIKTYDQWLNS